jgi:predicted RecA/RadA family phage recombinase
MTINYIELGKAIAANTPAPTNAGEWSIFGILIAVLIFIILAGAYYHVWKEKKNIASLEKMMLSLSDINQTLVGLNIYFAQQDETRSHQAEKQSEIAKNQALIMQKLNV